jgi:hypothetical protein
VVQLHRSYSGPDSAYTFPRGRRIRRRRSRSGLVLVLAAGLCLAGCRSDSSGADWSVLLAALLAGQAVEEPAGPGLPAGVAAINYQGEYNEVTERDTFPIAPVDTDELAAALASNGAVLYDSLGENIRPLRIRFTGDLEPGLTPAVQVVDSTGNLASGVVSFQLPRTLIFTPTTAFAHNTEYNVSVTGIRFADGRQRLAEPLQFEFGTVASTPGMPYAWTLEVSCPDQSLASGESACRLRLHCPIAIETAMATAPADDFPALLDAYLSLSGNGSLGAGYATDSFLTESQFVLTPGSNGLFFEFPSVPSEGYYGLYRYAANPGGNFDPNLSLLLNVEYKPAGVSPDALDLVIVQDGAWHINVVYSRTR